MGGRGGKGCRALPDAQRGGKMTVGKTAAQTYNVFSHRSGRYYHVKRTRENTWSCTCLHYQNRKTYCRHIRAAEDVSGIRRLRGGRKMVIGPVDPVVCRKGCASGVIKKGWRRTARGRVQRYACKACGARLTASMGFEGMRVPPEIIGAAISMYFNGESYRDVAETVGMLGYPVTHKAVMNWVEKFIPLIASYLASIRPRVSGRWRTDEMHMKVSGETSYLYAIIDDESRFWISAQMAPAKDTANIKPLMRDSMRLTGRNPDVLTSDGGPQIKKHATTCTAPPALRAKAITSATYTLPGTKTTTKWRALSAASGTGKRR